MSADWPIRVSVILAVRNGEPLLRTAARGTRAPVDARFPWEVIVIDNGSTDGTSAVRPASSRLRLPNFQLLHEPTRRGSLVR